MNTEQLPTELNEADQLDFSTKTEEACTSASSADTLLPEENYHNIRQKLEKRSLDPDSIVHTFGNENLQIWRSISGPLLQDDNVSPIKLPDIHFENGNDTFDGYVLSEGAVMCDTENPLFNFRPKSPRQVDAFLTKYMQRVKYAQELTRPINADCLVVMQYKWMHLGSPCHWLTEINQMVSLREIDVSEQLGVRAYVIRMDLPWTTDVYRFFKTALGSNRSRNRTQERRIEIWILVPALKPDNFPEHPYYYWTKLKAFVGENRSKRLRLFLDINGSAENWNAVQMNENLNDITLKDAFEPDLMRWFGEGIAGLAIRRDCFTHWSKKRQRVRPESFKMHQFIRLAMGYGGEQMHVLLLGVANSKKMLVKKSCQLEDWPFNYVCSTFKNRIESRSERFYGLATRSGRDGLALPIAPLQTNITADNYNNWEMDQAKYSAYEDAICISLNALWNRGLKSATVMVLGAGQGPLVIKVHQALLRCRLEAENSPKNCREKFHLKLRIYAIEKNRNAWPSLRYRADLLDWQKFNVEIVQVDMRVWRPGFTADLIVSEMLGGFGCNELSPECLHKSRHLMTDETIVIPSQYTGYISPIMSVALRKSYLTNFANEGDYGGDRGYGISQLVNYFELAREEAQPAFTFKHPDFSKNAENNMYVEKILEFTASTDCELQAFLGSFSADLVPRHMCPDEKPCFISILPKTHTRGMRAWSPIVFLVEESISLKKGDILKVSIERCRNESSATVWYEWQLLSPVQTRRRNVSGKLQVLKTLIDEV